MPSVKERISAIRERRPFIDHLVRMQEHYGSVKAGQQAGAVTYFAFLSFFPILALAFFVVGWIAKVYPQAKNDLTSALNGVMPGLVGNDAGQIQIKDIESAAATLGIVSVLVLLYSGLGWLAAMRDALVVVFEVPAKEQPNFVFGKLRDLLTLVLIGVILLVSVAVAGFVGGFTTDLLDWLDLGTDLGWLVTLLSIVLGFGANMLLFFAMFVLLAQPHTPRRSLWSGALLGAIAFEALKQVSTVLFKSTQGNPAFQAFGIALIVLVWINYFSRVVLYAAAFAHTSRAARALRVPEPAAPVAGPPSPPLAARPVADEPAPAWVAPYAAGAVSTLGLMAVVRKITRKRT
ncbi:MULTISPECIES: YihY/virulence factor BrkB family protein [unclassified Nocardioides]|uniref:YihY/virulence factor BrkB family protein n=1 Tax=unclassified Nocardioides TaxID=2615069 RepID=UPI0009F06ED9|nr:MULTISPECIES: YihY/virulence factor BrkB family protein [unclassified Nocardioides]GAW52213.1 Ribonuclease BN [Nocardioides sp. PD653-B2]GAW56800.1 Ribonuclease BN [Nocardioides sp. PD653]